MILSPPSPPPTTVNISVISNKISSNCTSRNFVRGDFSIYLSPVLTTVTELAHNGVLDHSRTSPLHEWLGLLYGCERTQLFVFWLMQEILLSKLLIKHGAKTFCFVLFFKCKVGTATMKKCTRTNLYFSVG